MNETNEVGGSVKRKVLTDTLELKDALRGRHVSEYRLVYWFNLGRATTLMQAAHSHFASILEAHDREVTRLAGSEYRAEIQAFIERARKEQTDAREAIEVATSWQVPMIVTAVETYLEDALCEIVRLQPHRMRKSKVAFGYSDTLRSDTIDDLRDRMRRVRVTGWIQRGGPRAWIRSLTGKEWGVQGFDPQAAVVLDEMWALRVLIVHRAGLVDADFVARFPNAGQEAKRLVRVTPEILVRYMDMVQNFVEALDAFLLGVRASAPKP